MNNIDPVVNDDLLQPPAKQESNQSDFLIKPPATRFPLGLVYVGNFIEFLEFGLFSALLPFISHDFFSSLLPDKRALLSYFILYVGFLGRPIGGYFLGKIGDKKGSTYLLLFSVMGISLSCIAMACLPVFYGAFIVIPLLRFFQGFFTGAEQAAATTYILSLSGPKNSYGGMAWMISCALLGVTLAQTIAYFVSVFCPNYFGFWRVPFFCIAGLSLLCFFPRYKFYKKQAFIKRDHVPSNTGVKVNWRQIFAASILFAIFNSLFYVINVLINTYTMFLHFDFNSSQFLINSIATAFFAVCLLSWAFILDKIPHNPFVMMKTALVGITIMLPFTFYFHRHGFLVSLCSQLSLIACVQLLTVTSATILPALFPKPVRVLSTGVSLSLGNSVIGGFFPLMASLIGFEGNKIYSVVGGIFVLIFLGFFCVRRLDKTKEAGSFSG